MNFHDGIIRLEKNNPGEKEFLQAVLEVLESIEQVYSQYPQFDAVSLIERLTEPDRVIIFKVPCRMIPGKYMSIVVFMWNLMLPSGLIKEDCGFIPMST